MAGAGKKDEKEKLAPIVIKRIKKAGHGHHGGAWKVAYADFVTAMMAFFLLLWLLNVTTEEQKNAISNYFDPSHPKISEVQNGAGGILGGMALAPDGAMVTNVQPLVQPNTPDMTTRGIDQTRAQSTEATNGSLADTSEKQLEEELRKKEDERFKRAEETLKAEIANSPELKDLAKNLIIDITPEGMRIQIVDDKGRSMFPSGSAAMFDFMRQLLLKVTSVVTPMPNQVSVRGHTDSVKYKDPNAYDNWNLSADRAQASRRVMVQGGLPETRVENVMGRADREHLVPAEPDNPRNRRITIILLREHLTQAAMDKMKAEKAAEAAKAAAAAALVKAAAPASPVKGGIEIIDDTKPASAPPVAPAAQTPTPATPQPTPSGSVPAMETPDTLEPITPLPTINTPDKFQRQPQVMYFGDGPDPKADNNLYQGPAQSPFVPQIGPPQIHKQLFDLPSQHEEPAHKTGPIKGGQPLIIMPSYQKPESTPAKKALDFGDPVPLPTRPEAPAALPPAAAPLEIENNGAKPGVLEFDGPATPQPAPVPDLLLDNSKARPVILDLDDQAAPATPPPAMPAPALETPATKKVLTF